MRVQGIALSIRIALVGLLFLQVPAHAQGTGWAQRSARSGTPFAELAVEGRVARLQLSCSGGKPLALVFFRNDPAGATVRLDIKVAGAVAFMNIARTSYAHVWGGFLDDAAISRLSDESRVDFSIGGAPFGSASLVGSREAVARALGACAPALKSTTEAGDRAQTKTAVALPIGEGVWVEIATPCAAAKAVEVYQGNRWGSLQIIGGGVSHMVETLGKVEPGNGRGFVRPFYADGSPGGLEIAPMANGQATIRSSSYATGEVFWSNTYRRCQPSTLSLQLRKVLSDYGFDVSERPPQGAAAPQ